MVLRRRFPIVLAVLFLIVFLIVARGQAQEKRPGEVSLPLKDYLALVETVERIEKENARKVSQREAPVAEVVSQRVGIVIQGQETATVHSEFEVLIQGEPKGPVSLPVAEVPIETEVRVAGSPPGSSPNVGPEN